MNKRFLRHVPIIHYEVLTHNEKLLKELTEQSKVIFEYMENDEAITITFPQKEDFKLIALFNTDYQYKFLDRQLISKLIDKEIDRLTMLSAFNSKIPNISELQELNKTIGEHR